ncbi:hypothetical protein V6N13_054525 [Hibiscus sabdariffa]|uniref:Nickel/cobalt efflux system n=1 Tax=Hibiscus sabdariffa TaxID=183260 RepID=A0ABR2DXJ9_9ROSI
MGLCPQSLRHPGCTAVADHHGVRHCRIVASDQRPTSWKLWHLGLPLFSPPHLGVALACLANTDAVVSSLTGYTFWASKNGKDFNYLGPILFSSLIIILILTSLIQCRDFLWLHSLRHRLPDQALHVR